MCKRVCVCVLVVFSPLSHAVRMAGPGNRSPPPSLQVHNQRLLSHPEDSVLSPFPSCILTVFLKIFLSRSFTFRVHPAQFIFHLLIEPHTCLPIFNLQSTFFAYFIRPTYSFPNQHSQLLSLTAPSFIIVFSYPQKTFYHYQTLH